MISLDAPRKRPGMYVGPLDDGTGLSNMAFEVIGNAFNEGLSGRADAVDVCLNADGSCTVRDNGRGMPVDMHKPTGRSKLEFILTELHAAGNFTGPRNDFPGRLYGVGLAVVNALSDRLALRTVRDGHEYAIAFRCGEVVAPMTGSAPTDARGTELTFLPSAAIFPAIAFDFEGMAERLKVLAPLNARLALTLTDERSPERRELRLNQSDSHD